MRSTLVLLLIGFAGLGAAMWALARGFGAEELAYRRRQKGAGLGLAALLFLLGIVQVVHSGRIVQRLTTPNVDGAWAAGTIDGRAVPPREYRIEVAKGKVAGGRDACNDWGFGEPETEGGERTINTTLVGCPEDDRVRKVYWTLALAKDSSLELRGDGTLRLAARGHEGIFRRCRWTEQPLPPGIYGTGPRVCAVT